MKLRKKKIKRRIYNSIGIKEKVPNEANPGGRLEISKSRGEVFGINRVHLGGRLHSENDIFLLVFKKGSNRIGPEVARMDKVMKNLSSLAKLLHSEFGISAKVLEKGLNRLNNETKDFNKKILSPRMPGRNKFRTRKR